MELKNALADILEKEHALNREEIEIICSYFCPEDLNKEDVLLMAGNVYKKIVFVVEGILRLYVIDPNGEEVVKNYIEPGCFFSDMESFDNNHCATFNVSAVTDCKILTLSKPDANRLVSQVPKWDYMMKQGAMQAMSDMIRKQEFLRIGDSSDQYQHFVKHFPLLAQQVPLKYIASYLRITQSSLSRIRRQH